MPTLLFPYSTLSINHLITQGGSRKLSDVQNINMEIDGDEWPDVNTVILKDTVNLKQGGKKNWTLA